MNAEALPAADREPLVTDDTADPVEAQARPSAGQRIAFEALLGDGGLPGDGGMEPVDGDMLGAEPLRGGQPAAWPGGAGRAPGEPPAATLFGATMSLPTRRAGDLRAGTVSLGLAPLGALTRAPRGAAAQKPAQPEPPSPDTATREDAELLVRELAESLFVAAPRQAGHAAVQLELKGRLLSETQVTLLRQGHRLTVEIAAGSDTAYRALRLQVGRLQEALVQSAPGCFVDVALHHRAAGDLDVGRS